MAFLTRIAFAAALFCIPSGAIAQAQSDTPNKQTDTPNQSIDETAAQAAVGVFCDTPEQLQQYIKLHVAGAEPASALQTVNTESHNPRACGVLTTAFIENKEVSHVSISEGILRLVQITVIATRSALGWQRVTPTIQYTALFVKATEV